MATFEIPDGWCVQALRFTLDPTEEQARSLARHFGARRKAYNWTVGALKADIEAWHAVGGKTAKPSLRVLRKWWNTVKNDVCVNAETAVAWWPECSKEAYADGIAGAVHAYWNWQTSRCGKRAGKRVGFPRFKRKGRDADRVCLTTGAMRVEPDRRHLTLPVIGTVRTHQNTRRIERRSSAPCRVHRWCARSQRSGVAHMAVPALPAPEAAVYHGWESTSILLRLSGAFSVQTSRRQPEG